MISRTEKCWCVNFDLMLYMMLAAKMCCLVINWQYAYLLYYLLQIWLKTWFNLLIWSILMLFVKWFTKLERHTYALYHVKNLIPPRYEQMDIWCILNASSIYLMMYPIKIFEFFIVLWHDCKIDDVYKSYENNSCFAYMYCSPSILELLF